MPVVNPEEIGKGFEVAWIQPGLFAAGGAEPWGTAIISHCVAVPFSVHETDALVADVAPAATAVGLGHVGGVHAFVGRLGILRSVAEQWFKT